MTKEKVLSVKSGENERIIRYYIEKRAASENEFGCDMYAVGIEDGESKSEIENFSPDISEAESLFEYLYKNLVTANCLYAAAEEFVVNAL